MRRAVLLIAVLCAAVGGGATWLALGASGQPSGKERSTAAPAPRAAAPAAETEQPPIPTARPKVVQPVAGEGVEAEDEAVEYAQDDESKDRAPTRAASAAKARGGKTAVSGGVKNATALPNGIALPPLEAPPEVLRIIEAGNVIARSPYKWGGGHGKWVDTGYDCSGSVSFALAAAGMLEGPLASGPLMKWGKPGKGKWITIYSNPGHVFMVVAGLRFDTSAAKRSKTGSRWTNDPRPAASGYAVRHWPGF